MPRLPKYFTIFWPFWKISLLKNKTSVNTFWQLLEEIRPLWFRYPFTLPTISYAQTLSLSDLSRCIYQTHYLTLQHVLFLAPQTEGGRNYRTQLAPEIHGSYPVISKFYLYLNCAEKMQILKKRLWMAELKTFLFFSLSLNLRTDLPKCRFYFYHSLSHTFPHRIKPTS